MRPDQILAFWRKVDRSGGREACWPWLAGRSAEGYGRVKLNGKLYGAHRIARHLTPEASEPRGPYVLHECDNPPCCNPAHLRWGTARENAQQAAKSGRMGSHRNPRPERGATSLSR